MSKNFDDLLSKLKGIQRKKLAVAVAQDEPVLEAVKEANDKGIADAILVGNKEEISLIAKNIGMDLNKFEIVNIEEPKKAYTRNLLLNFSRRQLMPYCGYDRSLASC